MSYQLRVIPRLKRRTPTQADNVKVPYGLNVIESCTTCSANEDRIFCNLSKAAVETLTGISCPAAYPKGSVLFVEGQPSAGVFVICAGRVKLTARSNDGKSLILRIAGAGEVVGLPSTISGEPYEVTAQALEPIQASFIQRETFLQFLREHGEVALRVAQILSDIYRAVYQEIRYLGLSGSAAEKFARFLLDLTANRRENEGPISAKLALTHEEIAEMIGASRETVTRLFADFKRKNLIAIQGPTLLVSDKSGLEKILAS